MPFASGARPAWPFDDLTADERYTLAFQGAHVRQTLFVFFTGIEHFDLLQLTQEQLGKLIVPPDVWLDSQGQFYLFSHYITTTTDEPVDARSVQQPADGYKAPTDPLTLIGVGTAFAMVAMLACWAPIRRATATNPVEALRYE